MVEPVPYVFKKLANRYGKHPRVALENAAISSTSGQLPFYHLRQALPDEEVWEWYHALGSFRKEVILSHKHLIADIEDRVVEIKVPGLTFDDICAKHGFSHLDLIQIDTEGYDFEIIKTINFDHWQPRMLIYEHHHLSPEDKRAANDLLRKNGYSMFEYGLDTACLLTADEATQQSRLGRYFRSLQTA
jgi:FkbM family methyltransferase